MSDKSSPSAAYAPWVALAVVLALFVLALIGVLVAALIILAVTSSAPAAAAIDDVPALNRLAVIADSKIYTINPDGSDRLDLAHTGRVPTAAVIWSRDGQRLIFVASELRQSRVTSAQPTGRQARVLYESDLLVEPFYLYGSPDDAHVAFLAPDPLVGMQLRLAEPDRANSARSAVSGEPSYASWSPDGQSLLVHIGGTSREAFVGTFDLAAEQPHKIETKPAAFQAPVWSPTGEAQWLYARQSVVENQLVISSAALTRTLAEFNGGITLGWSPAGQHIAYALNTPNSFLYEGLTVIDLEGAASQLVFKGNLLAFFWSPDGTKLAYLTGALVAPSSIGRAGGLAAPALPQRRTLQVTWHVYDLAQQRTIDLNTFEPTESFVYLIQYFDQFAQSVALWSPDSRSLVYTGQPLIGERGVYIIDTQDAAAQPRFIGPGEYAIWSWH